MSERTGHPPVVECTAEVEGVLDTKAIQNRLERLESSAAHLADTITDKKARDYFLRPILNVATDVKFTLSQAQKAQLPIHSEMWIQAAEFTLELGEQAVKHAQKMIATYGADTIRVIG